MSAADEIERLERQRAQLTYELEFEREQHRRRILSPKLEALGYPPLRPVPLPTPAELRRRPRPYVGGGLTPTPPAAVLVRTFPVHVTEAKGRTLEALPEMLKTLTTPPRPCRRGRAQLGAPSAQQRPR